MDKNNANIVLLGSGCFWHPEMIFHRTDGVISTKVGYAGGTTENPTYAEVCSGQTGHAEVVKVEFELASSRPRTLRESKDAPETV